MLPQAVKSLFICKNGSVTDFVTERKDLMTKQQFIDIIKEDLQGFLEEKYALAKVKVEECVTLNNGRYTGLIVSMPDSDVAPVLNLDSAYEEFKDLFIIDALNETSLLVEQMLAAEPPIKDAEFLSDFDKTKKHLYVTPVSKFADTTEIPVITRGDMKFVVKADLGKTEDGQFSMMIKNTQLKQWGISEEELFKTAIHNLSQIKPPKLMSMKKAMESVDPEIETGVVGNTMYILTCTDRLNGAALLLNENVMESVVKEFDNRNLFILPSSIHELILIPVTDEITETKDTVLDFTEMVKAANREVVPRTEILSDEVYHYDSKSHVLRRAEEYIESLVEKQTKKPEEEKSEVEKTAEKVFDMKKDLM